MKSVEELESAVKQLSAEEYRQFREWLVAYDNDLWDEQMERDAQAGRLDSFGREALDDLQDGRGTDL